METLETYFKKLASHEPHPAANMIAPWNLEEVDAIHAAFEAALPLSHIAPPNTNAIPPIIGNEIEDAFSEEFATTLKPFGYTLCRCMGPGYPDRMLRRLADDLLYPFEIKAKKRYDPKDTSRMVLTSGTSKLRRNFPPDKPLCHLLLTVIYSVNPQGEFGVEDLLYFYLQPWSLVEMRYEASVNPKLLGSSDHPVRHSRPAAHEANAGIIEAITSKTPGPNLELPFVGDSIGLAPDQMARLAGQSENPAKQGIA